MPLGQSRTTWLQNILASLAAASGVGYLATAYSISRWLTRRSRAKPCSEPRLDTKYAWEEARCRTADGLRLSGWIVTPPRPRATVALFHGLRDNRDGLLGRIAFLTSAGYRCVAFDHRGHGRSEGRKTSFGYFESRDATAVLDHVRRSWPHEPHAALGISMGAAALCFAADRARQCQAVILESLYHDLGSAFAGRLGVGYPAWYRRFSRGIIWVTERRLGVRMAEVAPVQRMPELAPTAVLLLTGSEDPYAPPQDVARLYQACAGPRELAVIPGAGHADVCECGAAAYRHLVLDFLRRRLGGPADCQAGDDLGQWLGEDQTQGESRDRA